VSVGGREWWLTTLHSDKNAKRRKIIAGMKTPTGWAAYPLVLPIHGRYVSVAQ